MPKDLKKFLQVRDETCRFPGCGTGATRCELDHTIDWQYGGPTGADNLAHLCPKHHRLKHHTNWAIEQTDAGSLTWTSPTRHTYPTEAGAFLPVTTHGSMKQARGAHPSGASSG